MQCRKSEPRVLSLADVRLGWPQNDSGEDARPDMCWTLFRRVCWQPARLCIENEKGAARKPLKASVVLVFRHFAVVDRR